MKKLPIVASFHLKRFEHSSKFHKTDNAGDKNASAFASMSEAADRFENAEKLMLEAYSRWTWGLRGRKMLKMDSRRVWPTISNMRLLRLILATLGVLTEKLENAELEAYFLFEARPWPQTWTSSSVLPSYVLACARVWPKH